MERFDKYDLLLEALGYRCLVSQIPGVFNEQDLETIVELSDEIGVALEEDMFDLILWNDDVNDMLHVVLALYEVCGLDNEDSMKIMLEAHSKGKAIAKSGAFQDLIKMVNGLNGRNINATIQFRYLN